MPTLVQLADGAILISWPPGIELSIHQQVMTLDACIRHDPFVGWMENVPAYHTLTVFFDPLLAPVDLLHHFHVYLEKETSFHFAPRRIVLPVCYDASLAPDLLSVSELLAIPVESIIRLHHQQVYHVFMIGFQPGFPYLGVLPPELEMPRKAVPSSAVPPGSVAIAGKQTGIYPFTSPGGWHVIGRMPLPLFQNERLELEPGDEISFQPIDLDAFLRYQKHPEAWQYE